MQRELKVRPIEKWKRTIDKNTVQYLGIATDEQERLMRLDGVKKISLLKKYGLTEDDAMQLCRDWGLLSPVYEFTDRGGAFSAPMQRRKSYATCVFSTLLCGFRLSSYKRCLTRQRIGGTEQKLFTILTPAYVKA